MSISIAIITGLICMVCWGIADFTQTFVIRKINSAKTMFTSNVIGLFFPILLTILFYDRLSVSLYDLIWISIGGIITAVALYYFFEGLRTGEVSIVVPVSSTFAIVTVILSVLFLGESLKILQIISIFVIMLGIILTSADLRKIRHIHTVKGVKEALIAMMGWGISFIPLGIVSKRIDFISLFVFSGFIFNGFMIGLALLKKGMPTMKDLKKKYVIPILLFNSVLYAGAWLSMNYGITYSLVSIVTAISSLSPAIAVVLAVLILKEKLVFNQKIGIITILVGLVLISV